VGDDSLGNETGRAAIAIGATGRRSTSPPDLDLQNDYGQEVFSHGRLRRVATMETGLFEIQAGHLNGIESYNLVQPASRQLLYALFEPRSVVGDDEVPASVNPLAKRNADLARCFLRLSNLPNYALDRLSRYEATLWRQVAQTVITLGALGRRKPQERRRPPRFGGLQELPNDDHDDG
jgi:hypothetical protein